MTEPLTRTAASAAVDSSAWRYLLDTLYTSVPVSSLSQGVEVARVATVACGGDADGHLRVDVRPERVELSLQTRSAEAVTAVDVALAERITAAVEGLGVEPAGVTGDPARRSVQMFEIAIDALDIAAIVPFWRAVLGYRDENGAVVDPVGQGPSVWFQQLDEPRSQRNRIHFDLTVSHEEAPGRIRAALAAGGTLVSDEAARAFWILADPEGNEVCVCTWQDRE